VARYLADTSAWNRSRVAGRWAELLEQDELALCTPVRLELLYSARGKTDFAELSWQLDGLQNLPTSRRAESLAVEIQSELAVRSQHRGPKPVDLLVAAIAQVHGKVLLHYDRHFDVVARVTGQPAQWLARRGSLD
jgi:predicted nucleic acid-binding protein